MLCWIAQNRRVILSLFHERWNGVMEGLTLMLSEDNPNCSFFQFLRLNGRSSGQCHLLLLLQSDSASCSCRHAPFLPYQRNLHFISLLHEMLHCVAAQRGALSPHQRQGNNQLLKLERKGITWRNATLLECFCSGVLAQMEQSLVTSDLVHSSAPVAFFQVPYSYCSSGPSLLCGIATCQHSSLKGKPWANHLKGNKTYHRGKLLQVDVPNQAISVLWQQDCITCPAKTGNFTCLIIADRCSSATKPPYWITWSSPAIKSAIHNRIF